MRRNTALFSKDQDLITLAEKIGHLLTQKKLKLTTAESCTGGGLAFALTSIPRASEWFDQGFVTYSNLSKQNALEAPENILNQFGAVSEQTVTAMAKGALKNSRADISIAVTGIAGPDGGSKEKPVGTVWFGIAYPELIHFSELKIQTFKKKFSGNRHEIREKSILFILEKCIECLTG